MLKEVRWHFLYILQEFNMGRPWRVLRHWIDATLNKRNREKRHNRKKINRLSVFFYLLFILSCFFFSSIWRQKKNCVIYHYIFYFISFTIPKNQSSRLENTLKYIATANFAKKLLHKIHLTLDRNTWIQIKLQSALNLH